VNDDDMGAREARRHRASDLVECSRCLHTFPRLLRTHECPMCGFDGEPDDSDTPSLRDLSMG
jgi:hypothetical protein